MHLIQIDRSTGLISLTTSEPAPHHLFPELLEVKTSIPTANHMVSEWESLVTELLRSDNLYVIHEKQDDISVLGANMNTAHQGVGLVLTECQFLHQQPIEPNIRVVYDHKRSFPYRSPLYHHITYAELGYNPLNEFAEIKKIDSQAIKQIVERCNKEGQICYYDNTLTILPSRYLSVIADSDMCTQEYERAVHELSVVFHEVLNKLSSKYKNIHWVSSIPRQSVHVALWRVVDSIVYTIKQAPDIKTLVVSV